MDADKQALTSALLKETRDALERALDLTYDALEELAKDKNQEGFTTGSDKVRDRTDRRTRGGK